MYLLLGGGGVVRVPRVVLKQATIVLSERWAPQLVDNGLEVLVEQRQSRLGGVDRTLQLVWEGNLFRLESKASEGVTLENARVVVGATGQQRHVDAFVGIDTIRIAAKTERIGVRSPPDDVIVNEINSAVLIAGRALVPVIWDLLVARNPMTELVHILPVRHC